MTAGRGWFLPRGPLLTQACYGWPQHNPKTPPPRLEVDGTSIRLVCSSPRSKASITTNPKKTNSARCDQNYLETSTGIGATVYDLLFRS